MALSTAHAWQYPELFVAEEHPADKSARPTVYLDTTIPSYLTAPLSRDITKARRQRITRVWWARYRPNCTIFVSDLLILEASAGNADAARVRLNAPESVETSPLTDYSDLLLNDLLQGPLPSKSRKDAEHIALAATNSVQFLLTWNYKHLANSRILQRVAQTCESYGFSCPNICTPETMVRTYAHERSTH